MNKLENQILVAVFGTAFWVPLMSSIGVLGDQVFTFLRDGNWPRRPFLILVQYLNPEWVADPQAWLGLHKALNFLPLSMGLFLISVFVIYWAALIDSTY